MTYTIVAKGPTTPAEEVDTAEGESSARYLVGEYQMAFGPTFSVWCPQLDNS